MATFECTGFSWARAARHGWKAPCWVCCVKRHCSIKLASPVPPPFTPSQPWVAASSAIGGPADKAPPPLCLSLWLRPLEGNHLPFWNPPPTKPPYFPQLGLKCLQRYRGKADSGEGREEKREEKRERRHMRLRRKRHRRMEQLLPSPPSCLCVFVSLSHRDRTEMLYHGRHVLIKPYQIYVSERESGTCKCTFSR